MEVATCDAQSTTQEHQACHTMRNGAVGNSVHFGVLSHPPKYHEAADAVVEKHFTENYSDCEKYRVHVSDDPPQVHSSRSDAPGVIGDHSDALSEDASSRPSRSGGLGTSFFVNGSLFTHSTNA
jgi:hypothetical protein